jgi:predicted nucleic acid-binding protein
VKIYFDTSALVTALVDQLPNHEAALACLAVACRDHDAVVSTHALAETYATLTALPLPRRIQPAEARAMVAGLRGKLGVLPLAARLYERAIDRVAGLGFSSGSIYDALHLECAEGAGCRRLHTYNLGHFQRLGPEGLTVLAP